MASKYRAIRSCYGFRGRFWEQGDVAEDVTESEVKTIPEHFEPIKPGVVDEVPSHPSFEPPEPTTLSDIQTKTAKQEKKARRE